MSAVALWSTCKNSSMNTQTHVDSRRQTLDLAAFSIHACWQGRLPGARQCGLQVVLCLLTPLSCCTIRHTCDNSSHLEVILVQTCRTSTPQTCVMMAGCCAEACTAVVLIGVMRLPGCPFDSAWFLVCEVCRLTAVWVDCRCFLSFVFLGGARRLELSPCNTPVVSDTSMLHCEHAGLPHLYGHVSILAAVIACSTISSAKYDRCAVTSVAVSSDRCLSKTSRVKVDQSRFHSMLSLR